MTLDVSVDEFNSKFFVVVEGQECTLKFRVVNSGVLDYFSTYVPAGLRNRGIASVLVQFALEHARDHGYTVIPSCSYVREYVDQHGEWRDVVQD